MTYFHLKKKKKKDKINKKDLCSSVKGIIIYGIILTNI